jgi:hypothetical protein
MTSSMGGIRMSETSVFNVEQGSAVTEAAAKLASEIALIEQLR